MTDFSRIDDYELLRHRREKALALDRHVADDLGRKEVEDGQLLQ